MCVVYNSLVFFNSDDIEHGHHGDDLCGHTSTRWWPLTCFRSINLGRCDSVVACVT